MGDFHSPMKCISPNARVLTPKPQVQQTLDLRQKQTKARNSITWFFVNSTLLGILVLDILYGGEAYKPFYWIQWCLISIFALNALYHITQYTITMVSLQPVLLSPRQRRLLGVLDEDPLFKSEPRSTQKFSEATTPLNFSCIGLNRRSGALASPTLNDSSKDYSQTTSPFYKYCSGTSTSPHKLTMSPNSSLSKSLDASMNGSFISEDLIHDEEDLQSYLKEVAQRERKTAHATNIDQPSNLLSSFWSHPATRSPGEVSPMLRRCTYQLAPTIDKSKSTSPGAEEGNSPRGTFGSPDVWRKYRVDPNKVNQWTANLRMWISKTVVERVALEIDNICSILIRYGLSDSQPGHVSLDRLRKLAQSQFISDIPTLPTLVPFLEVSSNQDYVVKRIKTLAKGGSMSEFKWNSGASHNGKEWDSSLPSDSALIMHLVATYMDTQLEAPLDQPDAKPFTSRYMAKSGMELPSSKGPIIVCQSVNPPHYNLAHSGDSLPAKFEDVPRGRNNLFHTLLLFLYIIKTEYHGMLGRVSLGMSGVNVLWVIDG